MTSDTNNAEVKAVHEAERRRGKALVAGNHDALAQLLSPTLSHTHTPGHTETLEEYLRFVREDVFFLDIRRDKLTVRLFGTVAVMTGLMDSVIQIRANEQTVSLRAQVLQVWLKQDEEWRLEAFQATAIAA
ncbi:hypothetical protein Sj15T_05280 [Sphingobium sp. TA15]|uniref:DUF4440 domain-containing protein n=1 Tax=Sphingobium indicum (strain DSM 16413 / CCM 7287 / MTCC 6362 / UT26 / NBRC 101211 / UT26S) TaxID=452662 RepID=D4Z0S4_SPHIU|nr:nuclear transport factor 2 family protein [Sphingobium indicum]BAI96206.1 hypothetical protein SJA_C1-13720 [Sphingobium indicum UT26S]BDD65507.1 hypothetical protein Sj15T_05280 [Sphingobium sp. TA15]